jgi:single-stranded-DNA-specific exonuclease
MKHGIECLLTDDPVVAQQYAVELDAMNKHAACNSRRYAKHRVQRSAFGGVAADGAALPWSLCLYDSSWHQGVIGVLAGKIKDRFHRPAIMFADAGAG